MQKKHVNHHSAPLSPLVHSPFGGLKGWTRPQNISYPRTACLPPEKKEEFSSADRSEEQLFCKAMEGVKPVSNNRVIAFNSGVKRQEAFRTVPEDEALSRLNRLVDRGEGFIVSDTPEYIEGIGYNVHRKFARKLHEGDYSIQAHIDLHGLSVDAAREEFEAFLKASVQSGKRAVLIIHGRGLSSPGEPVLKNKSGNGSIRATGLKRVIAFTSAQSYDGGAGATYVLLRERPVSKRSGKKGTGT